VHISVARPPSPNLLLAALPAADRARLLGQREPVELLAGRALIEPGETIRHVLFPIEGFISLIAPISATEQLEMGLVGTEGAVNAVVALGVGRSALRAVVQGGGAAWEIDLATFRSEAARSPALRRVIDRYLFVLLSQFALTAACTRFHYLDARLARSLLTTRDRAHSNSFLITHEYLAHMLGVRRVGVTRAATEMQRRELIRYYRGSVKIIDPSGLEAAACTCYAASKGMYASVLG
jgi:CRP-like cAMP-binding protein